MASIRSWYLVVAVCAIAWPGIAHAGGPSGCINCAPLANALATAGPVEVRVINDGAYLAVGLRTATTDRSAQGTIDASESYAVCPTGKIFNLIIKPDRSRGPNIHSRFTADHIWLRDTFGHEAPWTNGEWRLYLALHTPLGKPAIYQTRVHIQTRSATKYIEIDL